MEKAQFIETAARHLVIAAIWADAEDGTSPRANKDAHREAVRFVSEFVDAIGPLWEQVAGLRDYGSHPDAGSPAAAFGHDLWLTVKGHGVGFDDREELKIEPVPCELLAFDRNHRLYWTSRDGHGEWTLGECLQKMAYGRNFISRFECLDMYAQRGWVYLQGVDAVINGKPVMGAGDPRHIQCPHGKGFNCKTCYPTKR